MRRKDTVVQAREQAVRERTRAGRRVSQGQHFGMGGGVVCGLAFVVARRDDLVAFESDMGKFERRLVRISQLPDDAVAETRVLLAEIKTISEHA